MKWRKWIRPLIGLFALIFGVVGFDHLRAEEFPPRLTVDTGARRIHYVVAPELIFIPGGPGSAEVRPGVQSLGRSVSSTGELAAALAEWRRKRNGPVDLVAFEEGVERNDATRVVVSHQARVDFRDPRDAEPVLRGLGFRTWRSTEVRGLFIVEAEDALDLIRRIDLLRGHPKVASAEPITRRPVKQWLIPNDVYFSDQWNLFNTAPGGVHVNVTPAWDGGTGDRVVIGIVDDGVELGHIDLSRNARLDLSWNFETDSPHRDSDLSDDDIHGTLVAGIAAARGNNSIGVAGVAFTSGLASLRIPLASGFIDDVTESRVFSYQLRAIRVLNNSWGPAGWFVGPERLAREALRGAAVGGRIIIFASGNEGPQRYSNYNGYANSPYVICVGAVGRNGRREPYSERGTNVAIMAPAGVPTTDRTRYLGLNRRRPPGPDEPPSAEYPDPFVESFPGTSAAAAHVSGAVALILERNAQLSWRDVTEILMRSAKNDLPGGEWITNGAGLRFNMEYGAGLLDIDAAIRLARRWSRLARASAVEFARTPRAEIPDGDANGLTVTINVPVQGRVEHTVVTVTVDHDRIGDLELDVVSPSGTRSPLLLRGAEGTFNTWSFMTLWNWGESANGAWSVSVRDRQPGVVGTLERVVLTLHVGGASSSGGGGGSGGGGVTGDIRSPDRQPNPGEIRSPISEPEAPDVRTPSRSGGGGGSAGATGTDIRSPDRQPQPGEIRSPRR